VVSYSNLGIISGEKLRFGNCGIRSALMTAAVKRAPYFQLTVCTFSGDCTMSSNLYATEQDKRRIETFLYNMEQELLSSIT
jgi:NRPS condensation-like uncharacterized protein